VVIPVEAHALALPGTASVVASIHSAREKLDKRVDLLGIVACRVNATVHARKVVDQPRAVFGSAVLEQTIRLAEAPVPRMPITLSAPWSVVAQEYRAVARDLLVRMGGTTTPV
jgi:chromosome partitioning protein